MEKTVAQEKDDIPFGSKEEYKKYLGDLFGGGDRQAKTWEELTKGTYAVHVPSEELSRLVQEILFKKGYFHNSFNTKVCVPTDDNVLERCITINPIRESFGVSTITYCKGSPSVLKTTGGKGYAIQSADGFFESYVTEEANE